MSRIPILYCQPGIEEDKILGKVLQEMGFEVQVVEGNFDPIPGGFPRLAVDEGFIGPRESDIIEYAQKWVENHRGKTRP